MIMYQSNVRGSRRHRSARRRLASESGTNIIEFAMTIPLLLIAVLGIVDFAFVFQRTEVVTNAAREGARVASLPGYGTPDVQNRVNAYLQAGGVPTAAGNPIIVVTPATVDGTWPASTVSVDYTHNYMFIGGIAGWFGGSFTTVPLRSHATVRHELDAIPAP